MIFVEMLGLLPDLDVWGSFDGERSYVISFDKRFPERGYQASWSPDGVQRNFISSSDNGFASFDQARAALADVRQKFAN